MWLWYVTGETSVESHLNIHYRPPMKAHFFVTLHHITIQPPKSYIAIPEKPTFTHLATGNTFDDTKHIQNASC